MSPEETRMMEAIDRSREKLHKIARRIWEFKEVGWEEFNSSLLLMNELEREGFEVERGLTGRHPKFDQEIDMNASDEDRVKDLDEQSYLSGYNLDADMLVCNELSLYLPMKVLCKDNCKGICSRCGANLNYGTCGCDTRSLDPRMAVIQDIFKQFKEV